MRYLGRIIGRGPRRIALLGVIVLLPAGALGMLAFRTFRGEQVREEYQRRERQQQILRLLESDLINWVLSWREDVAGNKFALEIRQNRIILPRLNAYLPADHERAATPRLSNRDSNLWRNAQAAELRGGMPADAIQDYRRLLSGDRVIFSWSKLALLRLTLQRADSSGAAVWLREIQEDDQAAVTESGIPIWVAAALLLIEHESAASLPEMTGFLDRTLSLLSSGRWPLNAAQWTYYAREICYGLDSTPDLCSEALAAAGFLESLAGAVQDVLALNQSLEWRRDQPFAARHLPRTESLIVLFPGEDRNTGCVLSSDELIREAETRLTALTAAEDFHGRIGISGDNTQPSAASLAALPFLEVSFSEREQTLWRSHLRRYSLFYAAALLLLGAGTGLFFTYRAVAREMEVSRMKADFGVASDGA